MLILDDPKSSLFFFFSLIYQAASVGKLQKRGEGRNNEEIIP